MITIKKHPDQTNENIRNLTDRMKSEIHALNTSILKEITEKDRLLDRQIHEQTTALGAFLKEITEKDLLLDMQIQEQTIALEALFAKVHERNQQQPKDLSELLSRMNWNEFFSHNTPVDISDPQLAWIDPPSGDFIDYVMRRTPLGFDGTPPDEFMYKVQPTFMMAQMHRLWLTMKIVSGYLRNWDDFSIVDVGAFPFSLDIILREYIRFKGKIHVTTNWNLEEAWIRDLSDRGISVSYCNLDPYVVPGSYVPGMKDYIGIPDNSVDMVICTHVVEHLYHPVKMFEEVNRILKKGGTCIVSTDNAFRLQTILNFCHLGGYIHEPVEGTAAMSFHQWRGHNRFFSWNDLKNMLEKTGFGSLRVHYFEVLYNSFSDDHFRYPVRSLPKWHADILTWMPDYRNELFVIAKKT